LGVALFQTYTAVLTPTERLHGSAISEVRIE